MVNISLEKDGLDAHWRYKENFQKEKSLEDWITQIRELLENPDPDAIEFLDEFKLNLFEDEVFTFTPKGDLVTLPANSTALDFAFEIHTEVGAACLGAKVNHRLVPLSHVLKNGDQVEIITSKKQRPSENWLKYVTTAKAKSKIKSYLKEQKSAQAEIGKEILQRKLKKANLSFSNKYLQGISSFFQIDNTFQLYFLIGTGQISNDDLNKAIRIFQSADKIKHIKKKAPKSTAPSVSQKPDLVIVGEDSDIEYSIAKCCNPIPGDDIFGFVTIGEGIKIHRTNCPNGINLMSRYGYRIVKAEWAKPETKAMSSFPVGIKITGIDNVGIVSSITDIISKELKVNMDSITIASKDGAFEGSIILYIYDTDHLENMINKIKELQSIESVIRFKVEEPLKYGIN